MTETLAGQAVAVFTENGTAELINLIGLYCAVSVILNGFDVPIPEDVRGQATE